MRLLTIGCLQSARGRRDIEEGKILRDLLCIVLATCVKQLSDLNTAICNLNLLPQNIDDLTHKPDVLSSSRLGFDTCRSPDPVPAHKVPLLEIYKLQRHHVPQLRRRTVPGSPQLV